MEKQEKTKVIFRAWPQGCEVVALFPEMAVNPTGYNCGSYMHVGQHSAASPDIVRDTRPARPDEYRKLYDELTAIGYNLEIIKRFRYSHQKTRQDAANLLTAYSI